MKAFLGIWQRATEEERKLITTIAERIFKEQLNILESCGRFVDGEVRIPKKYFMEMLVRPAFGDSDSHYEKLLDVLNKIEKVKKIEKDIQDIKKDPNAKKALKEFIKYHTS